MRPIPSYRTQRYGTEIHTASKQASKTARELDLDLPTDPFHERPPCQRPQIDFLSLTWESSHSMRAETQIPRKAGHALINASLKLKKVVYGLRQAGRRMELTSNLPLRFKRQVMLTVLSRQSELTRLGTASPGKHEIARDRAKWLCPDNLLHERPPCFRPYSAFMSFTCTTLHREPRRRSLSAPLPAHAGRGTTRRCVDQVVEAQESFVWFEPSRALHDRLPLDCKMLTLLLLSRESQLHSLSPNPPISPRVCANAISPYRFVPCAYCLDQSAVGFRELDMQLALTGADTKT